MRGGVARVQGATSDNADLKTLVGNGYLADHFITPEEGERYQGVVGLEGDTWRRARRLPLRSEQLPTRLFICGTGDVDGKPAAGGMLLRDAGTERAGGGFRPSAMLTVKPLKAKSC